MNTRINTTVFKTFPMLETERLVLREFYDEDLPEFFAIRSSHKVMQYMDSFPHQSYNESKEMIIQMEESFREQTGINWAIELLTSRRLIGYIGLWRIMYDNVRAELGYSLHPDYWGKGYMKEAILAVIKFGFEELGVHGIEASVNPENRASIGLLKKLGFRKEAHFRENYYFNGDYVDSQIFCMIESDFLSVQ
jgi:[ribosomal protein S5]-alanine N-acetyltransferase